MREAVGASPRCVWACKLLRAGVACWRCLHAGKRCWLRMSDRGSHRHPLSELYLYGRESERERESDRRRARAASKESAAAAASASAPTRAPVVTSHVAHPLPAPPTRTACAVAGECERSNEADRGLAGVIVGSGPNGCVASLPAFDVGFRLSPARQPMTPATHRFPPGLRAPTNNAPRNCKARDAVREHLPGSNHYTARCIFPSGRCTISTSPLPRPHLPVNQRLAYPPRVNFHGA